MTYRPHILIVGAGIIGASIAWHLVRAGAHVTVTDSGEGGGVATRNSWAWINASWSNPEPYFRLRVRAMDEWHRLEREVSDLHVAWVGSLLWEIPPEDLKNFQAGHSAWGYDVRVVERAEIHRIEPHLADPPEFAVHAPIEGAVEPLATSRALLAAADALGAIVIANNPVSSLILRDGRVIGVEPGAGPLEADEVVLAAGVRAPELVAPIGLTLPIRGLPPCSFAHSLTPSALTASSCRPRCSCGRPRKVSSLRRSNYSPGGVDADGMQAATATLDLMKGMITPTPALLPDSYIVGVRPIPKDRFPVVGRAPGVDGLYVAVMHSGITLAPAMGRFVADEILTGRRDSLIRPYGLERFPEVITGPVSAGQFQTESAPKRRRGTPSVCRQQMWRGGAMNRLFL
jgi:glycine/D-amino acid oxidase-like deaminating enzyme